MALSQPTGQPIEDFPIDADALVLVNMLERLLDRIVGVYEQRGVPLPLRRYWMLGAEVPEDCAQVVVTYIQSYLGLPGDAAADPQACNAPRTGVFNVLVTRDYPIGENGKAVAPERITAASKWGAVDNAVLLWALDDLNTLEDGWKGPGAIATVNTLPPNGGVQTTVLNVSLVIF